MRPTSAVGVAHQRTFATAPHPAAVGALPRRPRWSAISSTCTPPSLSPPDRTSYQSHHSCIITSVSAGLRNTRPNARSTKIAAPSIPRAGTLPKILSPRNVLTDDRMAFGKMAVQLIVRLFGYKLTILTIRGGVQPRRVGCRRLSHHHSSVLLFPLMAPLPFPPGVPASSRAPSAQSAALTSCGGEKEILKK